MLILTCDFSDTLDRLPCRFSQCRNSNSNRGSVANQSASSHINAATVLDCQAAVRLPGVSNQAIDLAFPNGDVEQLQRPLPGFTDIETAVQDFRDGKFLVVLDNEDRENEGDLIIAAEKVCQFDHHTPSTDRSPPITEILHVANEMALNSYELVTVSKGAVVLYGKSSASA